LFCNTFVVMKQTLTIDGENFSDLEGFYNEVDRLLTKDLDWQTGHNLDAFNDLLCGGFGVFEYEEQIDLIWKNFAKSIEDLGEEKIEVILEIIDSHKHIELSVLLFS